MTEHSRIPSVAGKRRKAREFALLGIYESIINPAADFAAIDANLVSVITDDGQPVSGSDLTPAAVPQVPGAGRSSPAPKNSAMACAGCEKTNLSVGLTRLAGLPAAYFSRNRMIT